MATQHFLQIEGDSSLIVVCTAPAGAPCHMVCDRSECVESCGCEEPTYRDIGECNYIEWLNNGDDLMENGSGVAELPIDVKWEGDYYSWSFAKPGRA